MTFQFYVMIIRFLVLVLFFIVIASGSIAIAQQNSENKDIAATSQMSLAGAADMPKDIKKNHFELLQLYVFEAALGNWSSCTDHDGCLEDAKRIAAWLCASNVCDGKEKDKSVADCLEISKQFTNEISDRIGAAYCFVIKSPSQLSRTQFLKYFHRNPHAIDEGIVEYGAYLMAMKGAADSCENYIKSYVGEYGSQWAFRWYRRMSGCRILAKSRTRIQEEKDFDTWFNVVEGSNKCSDIVNVEMRKACSAPGAASPIPKADYVK